MKRTVLALIVASSMALPATSANAVTTIYRADLSGLQEAPTPNMSPGTGFAVITINDIAETMRVESAFSGLLGTTTAAHIHCCAPAGLAAGVATTTPTFPGFPGGQSGVYDVTFNLTDADTYNPAFVSAQGGVAGARATLLSALGAGNTYFNIHTTSFPGGEIRGQLAAIPEPSTWAMMLLGFGAAGVALRRRRRLTYSIA